MTTNNTLWIASFDIGKVNFAFYIEEINPNNLKNICTIPKHKRYNSDGTPTNDFENIIDQVCSEGQVILFSNNNITKNCDKKAYFDPEILHNLTELLDEYSSFWDNCTIFVIERQMSFGRKFNTMALKIAQHCCSYFLLKYGRSKTIVDFPAYHKTQLLGAEKILKKPKKGKLSYKTIDKTARKKWCIEKASDILTQRNDIESLSEIMNQKKCDDICDCICQLQAYKILYFI